MKSARFLLGFALPFLACTSGSEDTRSSRHAVIGPEEGSTDPLVHLNVIAAPEMEGRGTASPGHQRAADYVVGELRKSGVSGAFPTSVDNPYLQPFTVNGFPVAPGTAGHDHEQEAADFGIDLFEHAIFLNGNATTDTKAEMGQRLCQVLATSGERCPDGVEDGSVDPRPIVQSAAAQKTNNVVGLLAGSGPHKDEVILLSAHLDHLGKTGTNLYPGTDDNGSGSATMVAVMHALAAENRVRPLDRSVGFLWTSGEEKGLLGAAYYVDNPAPSIPLARIKQVVNMDMVGRWDDTRFSIGGDSTPASTAAAAAFEAANSELPVPFARINRDIQQYNRRQDGYAFSRRNVPAIFIFEGLSNPQGGGSLMPHYHKPTDTIANLMADNGGSKIRKMGLVLTGGILKIVNAP